MEARIRGGWELKWHRQAEVKRIAETRVCT
jgi:hypothetical protein